MSSKSEPVNHTENTLESMSFEQALSELEAIVSSLESGDVSLEKSIEIYSRGTALKKHCESKLQDAQMKIEKITLDERGEAVGTQALDAE